MAHGCSWFWMSLWRQKEVTEAETNTESRLERRLTALEIGALGVAATFGLAVFTITKEAETLAGPAVLASFLVAGLAAVFPGLCFAELAARLPLSGSGYLFSFAVCGELVAFIVGWSTSLGHAAGATAFAKAWSNHLDLLLDQNVSRLMKGVAPIKLEGFADSFDPLALGIALAVTLGLILKIHHASIINWIVTTINVFLIIILFIMAATTFDVKHWAKSGRENMTIFEKFAPHGPSGILEAAEKCFPAFIGFDVIATAAQEARTPDTAMPRSILTYIPASAVAFALFSLGFTLTSASCFLQPGCSVISDAVGWTDMRILIEIAALSAFASCLFASLYALSRIFFAMARDGLIFRFLAWTPARLKTPIVAAIFASLIVALTASLADTNKLKLIDLMSAGLLVSFSLVPLSLIFLRGSFDLHKQRKVEQPQGPAELETVPTSVAGNSVEELIVPAADPMFTCCKMLTCRSFFYHLFIRHSKTPTPISQRVTKVMGSLLFGLVFALAAVTSFLQSSELPFIIITSILGAACLMTTIILQIQPQHYSENMFAVPLAPWASVISLFITDYLMLQLQKDTWIRFGVWMAVGLPLYFLYGIANSKGSNVPESQKPQNVSLWIMESRHANRLGELSRVTEQTENVMEESVTQF